MNTRFSADVVDILLDKLATDDDFRALMLRDPRQALRLIGHETPAEQFNVPGADPVLCCHVESLASKEQFQASRQLIRERFLIQDFFMFFSDTDDTARVRARKGQPGVRHVTM